MTGALCLVSDQYGDRPIEFANAVRIQPSIAIVSSSFERARNLVVQFEFVPPPRIFLPGWKAVFGVPFAADLCDKHNSFINNDLKEILRALSIESCKNREKQGTRLKHMIFCMREY